MSTAQMNVVLTELPSAPVGKTGWPWTTEPSTQLVTLPNALSWPRVSVVTPSYNQGDFIEETIRSVLLQDYPNLEYLVIDGGSSDRTLEVIRQYEPWLSAWVSEKDRGQSHAINKGWARATGEIVAYLNSDDFYLPGTLKRAIAAFQANPDCALVYSDSYWVNEVAKPFLVQHSGDFDAAQMFSGQTPYGIPQPTAFMRREAVEAVGGLDETLQMAMDFDLWAKLLLRYPSHYVPGEPLAAMRFHSAMKTQTRVLDDRLSTLRALDRALADPRCPASVSRRGNRLYHRLYLDVAGSYFLERHDWRQALTYLGRAFRCRPGATFGQVGYRVTVRTYRACVPRTWQARLRRLRGTDLSELDDVRN